jgi:hypothetical protein
MHSDEGTRPSSFNLVNQYNKGDKISPLSELISQSRGSAVGIETGYGVDDRKDKVRIPVESYRPTHPPFQRVPGVLSSGVKWPGCEPFTNWCRGQENMDV